MAAAAQVLALTPAETYQSTLEGANLQILRNVKQFNNSKLFKFLDDDYIGDDDNDDELDIDDGDGLVKREWKDPAVVSADVATHIVGYSYMFYKLDYPHQDSRHFFAS
jgi:hypothetical protein